MAPKFVTDITRHYNRQLLLCSALLTLSSANYAFDNNGFSNVQAMDAFIRRFGVFDESSGEYEIPTYFLSLMNSVTYFGFAGGVLIGTWCQDRYGRRMSVFCMSLWALVTATLIVSAHDRAQMMVGRILNYFYVGMELAVIPVFQAELMPKAVRGLAVGSYQFSFAIGGVIVVGICRGTGQIQDDRAWRIPQGLYFIVPSFIASLIWRIPESPRWLLLKGKEQEARTALRRIRVNNDDESINLEIESIQLALRAEADQGRWSDLFKGTNRRRTLVVMGSNFFLQATGQAWTSSYGAVFVKSIGTVNPFTITLIGNAVSFFCTFGCMYLSDKLGRRPLLYCGAAGQTVVMFVMAALGTSGSQTHAVKAAIIACIPLYSVCFSLGWAPTNYIITSEIPEQRLRDKTVRIGGWTNIFTNFVVAFTLPYLLNKPYADLQAKVGFIYAPFCLLAFLFAYFYVPECRQRSLEEIDLMFIQRVGARQSSKWHPESTTAELLEFAERKGELGESGKGDTMA